MVNNFMAAISSCYTTRTDKYIFPIPHNYSITITAFMTTNFNKYSWDNSSIKGCMASRPTFQTISVPEVRERDSLETVFSPFNHLTWLLAQEYKSSVLFCHLVAVVNINKIIYVKYCVVMDEFVWACLQDFGVGITDIWSNRMFSSLPTHMVSQSAQGSFYCLTFTKMAGFIRGNTPTYKKTILQIAQHTGNKRTIKTLHT